jgi:adenosylcobinamide-phosphate synthase
VALDLSLGEPANRWHPVAWLGNAINALERRTGTRASYSSGVPAHPRQELLLGVGIVAATQALAILPYALLASVIGRLPLVARVVVAAVALKPLFALRELFGAVQGIERPLLDDDLPAARTQLARIVSRDVSSLGAPLIAAAAIESLCENLSDSVVAPLLAYVVGGLPLAAAYRAANTLDAMLGYRDWREYLGKCAARLDDAANLAPARVTAVLLCLAAPATGTSIRSAMRVAVRDHRLTASPNAGWPMAAAAGALGRRLEKQEHYVLNPGQPEPGALDLQRARRLAGAALGIGALGVLGASLASPGDAVHCASGAVRK